MNNMTELSLESLKDQTYWNLHPYQPDNEVAEALSLLADEILAINKLLIRWMQEGKIS